MNPLQEIEAAAFPAITQSAEAERAGERQSVTAKAAAIWAGLTENERAGVRFGMFPAGKMHAAEAEGFATHPLVCALMDCAKRDGGMRA